MGLSVISPGALSSFQDLGRHTHQHVGVSVGGAMDALAHRVANILVGNPEDLATLEVTLTGPVLAFDQAVVLAVAGADLSPMVDGWPVSTGRAFEVPAGGQLSFGQRRQGARAYIAVAGGYDIPAVLDSASTALMMGFGGFQGRSLRKGDHIALRPHPAGAPPLPPDAADLRELLALHHDPDAFIRITPGTHWHAFSDQARGRLFSEPYTVLAQSNRMGYRLQGPALSLTRALEVISEPVRFGTIQVPADGQPIVLMADRQTVGGYPKLAEVITVDLPRLAQRMPGEAIRFELIDVPSAQRLYLTREDALAVLARSGT